MRYIGNKTKLLEFIGDALEKKSIVSGRAMDAFAGTATVGRFLKQRGFEVVSSDIMTYSYVFQKAYVELDTTPSFDNLAAFDSSYARVIADSVFRAGVEDRFGAQGDFFARRDDDALRKTLAYLDGNLKATRSFIARNYAPLSVDDPAADRMYFTRDNAERIDAIRDQIHKWRVAEAISEAEFFVLLASLLEGADAVANTTGVYAAYVKSWQSNAVRKLRLPLPELMTGTGLRCEAHRGDAAAVARGAGELTLLYLDPPYNTRQYSGYYHIPELIAKGWFDDEPEIRGKTGLIDVTHQKSAWSTRRGCVHALEELLRAAKAEHVLMSYNSEGIIPEDSIRELFSDIGRPDTYEVLQVEYARYRSDSDHAQRSYSADTVTEKIYYVRLQ